MNINKDEVISRIEKYFSLVQTIENYYKFYGDKDLAYHGKIMKVLKYRENRDQKYIDLICIVNTVQKAITYETTSRYDEGWKIIDGNFYDEKTITIPKFILEDEFINMSKEQMEKILVGYYLDKEIKEFTGKIEYYENEIKWMKEKIDSLKLEKSRL